MYTFEFLFNQYKKYYIYKNGEAKFSKIEEKIHTSKKIALLCGLSIKSKIAPTRTDFSIYIHEIPYFILAGTETVAMAEFIAIKYWHEEVNSMYGLCTEHELYFKGEAITKHWQIRL